MAHGGTELAPSVRMPMTKPDPTTSVKRPSPQVGVPGSESSKSQQTVPDPRNADDKDGNEAQKKQEQPVFKP